VQSWSSGIITSMANFGHVIKIAFGNGNQAFVKNPSGSDTVLRIKYFSNLKVGIPMEVTFQQHNLWEDLASMPIQ
jgi:hypothetical protein